MVKIIHVAGKRKRAIAKAILRPGKGIVRINNQLIDNYEPELAKLKLMEPLILAGDVVKGVDINVRIRGGGISAQADAARLAIARALVQSSKKLEKTFLNYDRHLIVADVRRKEPCKPNRHGKARAKRQKSYR